MKNTNYRGSLKNLIFRGGSRKIIILGRSCLKRGAFTVCRFTLSIVLQE